MTTVGIEKNRRGQLIFCSLAVALLLCAWESDRPPEPAGAEDINAFTPVVASVLAAPVPVRGSDGRYHFVYELMISNSNNFEWELQSVEVFAGGKSEKPLHRVAAESVSANTQFLGTRA